jgi:hypothetical protein
MKLSQKQIDFIAYDSKVDVAEGPSGTGKSQAVKMKFVKEVNKSSRKQHFIAGQSAPVAYRNLIDDDLGILNLFPSIRPGTDTKKGNHLIMVDSEGREKIIYIFGFGDSSKWKKVLGSTVGCGIIDEGNLAPLNFIVQCFRGLTRPTAEFWLGLTLNPAPPASEIYPKFIDKARPLDIPDYLSRIPKSILKQLAKTKAAKDYTYWHFNHADNPSLTTDAVDSLKSALLPGSPEWLSLVEGIRAAATGMVYAKYLDDSYLYDEKIDEKGKMWPPYETFDIGIDIGSGAEVNAKSVMGLTGFIKRGYDKTHVYNVDDYLCKQQDADSLLEEWVNQIEIWWKLYQTRIRGVFVDGAGVSTTLILSLADRLKARNIYIDVNPAWKFGNDGGIKARMFVMYALINQHRIHFKKGNRLFEMLKSIERGDDPKTPIKDDNDIWNDYYDMFCYSWTHKTEEIR